MDRSMVVASLAFKVLEEHGSLDFLDLADMITDETEIPVREVERTLRILLLDGSLVKNHEYNITRKNVRNGTQQHEQAGLER